MTTELRHRARKQAQNLQDTTAATTFGTSKNGYKEYSG